MNVRSLFGAAFLCCLLAHSGSGEGKHRFFSFVTALSPYRLLIPNGNGGVIVSGAPWYGVGHYNSGGGGTLNPFGIAWALNGHVWTPVLCRADSDGDGYTNGEELGDPTCVWTPGKTPTRVANISHPGLYYSTPGLQLPTTTPAPVNASKVSGGSTHPIFFQILKPLRLPILPLSATDFANDDSQPYWFSPLTSPTMFPAAASRGVSFIGAPIGVVPLCVPTLPVNVNANTALTLDELAAILVGDATLLASVASSMPLATLQTMRPLLANGSVYVRDVIGTFVARGIAPFASGNFAWSNPSDWPDAILANPRIVWTALDRNVFFSLSTIGTAYFYFGFSLTLSASVYNLPCIPLRPSSAAAAQSAFITAASMPYTVTNLTTLQSTLSLGINAYPLVVSLSLFCRVVPVASPTALPLLQASWSFLERTTIVPALIQAAGGQAVGVYMLNYARSALSLSYFSAQSATNTLLYVNLKLATPTGLRTLAAQLSVAYELSVNPATSSISPPIIDVVTGVNPTATFQLTYSAVPAVAGAYSVWPLAVVTLTPIFNVAGVSYLRIPRCTLARLLLGKPTLWSTLSSFNGGIRLPSKNMSVVLPTGGSLESQPLLDALLQESVATATWCDANAGLPATSYATSALVAATTLTTTDSVTTAQYVAANPYSLAFVETSLAQELGASLVDIVDDSTGLVVSASNPANAATSAQFTTVSPVAAVAGTGGVAPVSVPYAINSTNPKYGGQVVYYPYVIPVYVQIPYAIAFPGVLGQTRTAAALVNFLNFATQSVAASAPITNNGGALLVSMLSPTWVQQQQYLFTCNGQSVVPMPVAAVNNSGTVAIAVVLSIVGVVAIAAGVSLGRRVWKQHQRTLHAPTDPRLAFTIMFTDIESSSALWGQYPEVMAAALEVHHAVVRGALERHRGYEVKTVGDSFMVAFRSAPDAIACALDIQASLYAADFLDNDGVIDGFYQEFWRQRANREPNLDAFGQTKPYANMWRGLRVRIGVHTGIGEVKIDATTNVYDYYGDVVNTAARIEDAGHGGQVIVSLAALEAAAMLPQTAQVSSAEGTWPSASGNCEIIGLRYNKLRGVTDPVAMFQLSTPQHRARRFESLRCGEDADGEADFDDDDHNAIVGADNSSSAQDTGSNADGGINDHSRRKSTAFGDDGSAVDGNKSQRSGRGGEGGRRHHTLVTSQAVMHRILQTLLKPLDARFRTQVVDRLFDKWHVAARSKSMGLPSQSRDEVQLHRLAEVINTALRHQFVAPTATTTATSLQMPINGGARRMSDSATNNNASERDDVIHLELALVRFSQVVTAAHRPTLVAATVSQHEQHPPLGQDADTKEVLVGKSPR